jgi:type IV pilus assembly protein PilE
MGILAAIAIPAYQDSVTKARRSEGMALAIDLAARQERFYLQNNTYTTSITGSAGLNTGASSENGYYNASTAACAGGTIGECFLVTVTAAGAQANADAKCRSFSLDSSGVKASKNSAGNASTDCW